MGGSAIVVSAPVAGHGGEGNTARLEHILTSVSSRAISQSTLPPSLQSFGWEPP